MVRFTLCYIKFVGESDVGIDMKWDTNDMKWWHINDSAIYWKEDAWGRSVITKSLSWETYSYGLLHILIWSSSKELSLNWDF